MDAILNHNATHTQPWLKQGFPYLGGWVILGLGIIAGKLPNVNRSMRKTLSSSPTNHPAAQSHGNEDHVIIHISFSNYQNCQ